MVLSSKKKEFFRKEEKRLKEILTRTKYDPETEQVVSALTGEQAAATQRELTQVQTQLKKRPSTTTVTTRSGEKVRRTLITEGPEIHVVETQRVEVPTEEVVTTETETEEVPVRYELQSKRYEKARRLLEPWHEAERKFLEPFEPSPGDPWFVQFGKGAIRVPLSIGTGIGVMAATTGVMIGHAIEKPGEVLLAAETGALQIPELIPKKIEKLKKDIKERPFYVGGQILGYGITFLGPALESKLRSTLAKTKIKPKTEIVSVEQPKFVKQVTKGPAITDPKTLSTEYRLASLTKADQRIILSKSKLLQELKGDVRGLTYGFEAAKGGKVRPFYSIETGVHVKTPGGTRLFKVPTTFKGVKTVTTPFMKSYTLGPLTTPSGFKETKWIWKPEFPTVKSFAPQSIITGGDDIIKLGSMKQEFVALDVKGISAGVTATKTAVSPTIQVYKIKHYTPVFPSGGGLSTRIMVKPPKYFPSFPVEPSQQFLKATTTAVFPHGATKFSTRVLTGAAGSLIISPQAEKVVKTLGKETLTKTILGSRTVTALTSRQLVAPITITREMMGLSAKQKTTPITATRQIVTPITATKQLVGAATTTRVTTGLLTATTPGLTTITTTYPKPPTTIWPGGGIIPPPSLDFPGGRRKTQKLPRGFAYKPSVAAIILGIKGKKPKIITGLGIRPILKRKKKRRSWLF